MHRADRVSDLLSCNVTSFRSAVLPQPTERGCIHAYTPGVRERIVNRGATLAVDAAGSRPYWARGFRLGLRRGGLPPILSGRVRRRLYYRDRFCNGRRRTILFLF